MLLLNEIAMKQKYYVWLHTDAFMHTVKEDLLISHEKKKFQPGIK